jgi:hypothetical protein
MMVKRPVRSERERFNSFVKEDPNGCWLWTGGKTTKGYGCIRRADGREALAHRMAYELFVGPIPAGLIIDHLCRLPSCVNPSHLEPVTNAENLRRGDLSRNNGAALRTHCKRGHPFDEANTYRDKFGRRGCIACRRRRGRDHWRRRHGW